MIKEKIRSLLITRQRRIHELRVRRLLFDYEDYIAEYEKNNGYTQLREGKLPVITEDLIDADALIRGDGAGDRVYAMISKLDDKSPVIIAAVEGRLPDCASDVFSAAFEADQDIDLIYADEDTMTADGSYRNPYFKPDWSPDSYLDAFYIGSVYAVRAGLLRRLRDKAAAPFTINTSSVMDRLFGELAYLSGGFDKREGMSFPVGHIEDVLFHRNEGADLFKGRSFGSALQIGGNGSTDDNSVRIKDNSSSDVASFRSLISLVIPSKDHPEVLKVLFDSIRKYLGAGARNSSLTDDPSQSSVSENRSSADISLEIIVVDNGSSPDHKAAYEKLIDEMKAFCPAGYFYRPMDFNFSQMCNIGADNSRGDILFFLNDDIELVGGDFLPLMTAITLRKRCGAVGIKLLYPGGDIIQHAGITGIHAGPMHKMQRMSDSSEIYFGANRGIHDMAGVTGAALMVEKSVFEEVGGFSEDLAVAFNDVDLCYRILEAGYYNVCCNSYHLIHHESLSRGDDNADAVKTERLMSENDILCDKHPGIYERDPFYNRHLDSSNVVPEYEFQDPLQETIAEIIPSVPRDAARVMERARVDECAWVRVDFAGRLCRWNRLFGLKDGPGDGYFIKGYGFVLGSDNAIYDRKLLLRRVEDDSSMKPLDDKVLMLDIYDQARRDVFKNLEGQKGMELTGFRMRIGDRALEKGTYRIGMLFMDKTSRSRICNWWIRCITVEPEE